MKIVTNKAGSVKPNLNVLVYGPPGAGKTFFAASAMSHKDLSEVLFLNVEGGLLTIADREYSSVDLGRDDDGRPNGNTLKDLEDIVWKVVTKSPGFEKFKTLVLDSVTELQVRDLEDVIAEAKKKGKAREIDELTQNDYGKNTSRMRRILRMLRDANVNVIVTALAKQVTPEGQSVPSEIVPSLTKALAESIQGYMDFVWYLFPDKEGQRRLFTQPTGPVRAKTRHTAFAEKLGNQVVNPQLPAIYDLLCKTLKETK
jgi:hypothetical protein